MNLFSVLVGLMYFVTDCDKTLVHYDDPIDTKYHSDIDSLIALPASSGSRKVGFVSKKTLNLVHEISQYTEIICVSGMRYSTMIQRQSLFPNIKYWIVENGGQIYQRNKNDPTVLEEVNEWQDYLLSNKGVSHVYVLNQLANRLLENGWLVDQRGYRFMIRVNIKNKSNDEIQQAILNNLSTSYLTHTFNLGYLDIYIRGCGKYPSVNWLLSHLQQKNQAVSSSGNDDRASKFSTDYVFMGDDTNDIEIASHATLSCIVTPCSEEMRTWLNSLSPSSTDTALTTTAALYTCVTSDTPVKNILENIVAVEEKVDINELTTIESPAVLLQQYSDKVFTARAQSHQATETLLQFILSKYNN